MTPDEFKAWRKGRGFSQEEAADAFGVSRGSIENYERGTRREDGRPVEIPGHVLAVIHVLDEAAKQQHHLDYLESLGGEGIKEQTLEHPEWRDVTLREVERQRALVASLADLLATLTKKKPA